jgi:hypothetical protein
LVSPFVAVVDVGTHAAAIAGTGIETSNPEINADVRIEASFGRKDLPFMRTKSRITFTSLYGINRERLKPKTGVIGHP